MIEHAWMVERHEHGGGCPVLANGGIAEHDVPFVRAPYPRRCDGERSDRLVYGKPTSSAVPLAQLSVGIR